MKIKGQLFVLAKAEEKSFQKLFASGRKAPSSCIGWFKPQKKKELPIVRKGRNLDFSRRCFSSGRNLLVHVFACAPLQPQGLS